MPSLSYHLKHPQAGVKPSEQVATPIIATYAFDGKRMRMGIGESIHPRDWNENTQRPRATALAAGALTKFLDRLEAKIREVHREQKSDFVAVTPSSLRTAVVRNIRSGGKRENFVQFFERYIEEKRPTTKTGTLGVYNSALKNLKRYTGAKDFNDIDAAWFEKYQNWMENYRDKQVTQGYAKNYVAKQIGIFKEVLTAARKSGLHRNDQFNNGEYKARYERTEAIFLTVDELLKIHRAELPPYLDRVRDRFLIGAFTLLRFSDSAKITLDHIRDGLLRDRNKKTGASVTVPIHWVIYEIMAKYPDGLPPSISNQKTNKFLKEIGKRAGITGQVVKSVTKGGVIVTTTAPKHDFITTHTARRSAASNMETAGIPRNVIMALGGWRTEAAYLNYIRAGMSEYAESVKDHPFFSKPPDPPQAASPEQ